MWVEAKEGMEEETPQYSSGRRERKIWKKKPHSVPVGGGRGRYGRGNPAAFQWEEVRAEEKPILWEEKEELTKEEKTKEEGTKEETSRFKRK